LHKGREKDKPGLGIEKRQEREKAETVEESLDFGGGSY
jgi:hypothetical protein